MKYVHDGLITNSCDIARYMIEQINSFRKNCDGKINVHLTFYDMNGQSTTTISYMDSSSNKALPGRIKTSGMISEYLLGYFIDMLLSEGYYYSSIDYEGYNINIGLEPNLSLTLSFPSKNHNSILLKDYLHYIVTTYNDCIKDVFEEDKRKAFIDAYQKELYFNSLSREDLLSILKDMDDEVLCYIMSFISDEQYEQIRHNNHIKNNEYLLVRRKAI